MSSLQTITAAASIGAFAAAPLAAPPPPVSAAAQTADIRLAANSVPFGAIPAAFIRNQLIFCGLICPSIVDLVTNVPLGAAQAPGAFVGALQSGSLLRAVGAAAESVTSPADVAAAGIITPDVFIVVPKAVGTTLPIVVVSAFNVGEALARPGQLLPTVQTARTNILAALNTPAGLPPTELPSGASGVVEVAAVAGVNLLDAVAFRAGELLISGAVHAANVTAGELADTGNARDALAAGAAAANEVGGVSRGIVTAAVDKAASDIRGALPPRALTQRHVVSAASTTSVRVAARPVAGAVKSAAHNLRSVFHGIAKESAKGRHRA